MRPFLRQVFDVFILGLKQHWAIFVLAFLLTVLIKAPLLAFPLVAKDAYQGINIYHFANLAVDEDFYLARGKEILEDHGLGNPLFREGKDTKLDYYFTINEYVLLLPFRWLGLGDSVDIVTLYGIYNAVGIVTLVLLVYFFALSLTQDTLFAVTAAVCIVIGYSLIENKGWFEPVFNRYGRSLYPYLSSAVFFGYLILCVKAVTMRSFRTAVWAGLVFGVQFYVYSYSWTFIALLNGCLFLIFVVQKDWRAVKIICMISGIGFAIGAYNVYRNIRYMVSDAGRQFSYFYGAIHDRALAYGKLGPAVLALFGGFCAFHRRHPAWPFLFSLLLSGWLSINQQIITGVSIQSNHYLLYYSIPALILAAWFTIWISLSSYRTARLVVCVAVIAVSAVNTAGEQRVAFASTLPDKLYEQRYRPALDVLKARSPGVVLAPDDDAQLLVPVYTPHDLFWQRELGRFNDNPIQRHRDALLVYLYLNKDARAEPDVYLRDVLDKGGSSFYTRIYQDIEGHASGWTLYEYEARARRGDVSLRAHREKMLGSLRREYDALKNRPDDFDQLLNSYGVRWILWDKNRHPEWDVGILPRLREVYAGDSIFLYERSG